MAIVNRDIEFTDRLRAIELKIKESLECINENGTVTLNYYEIKDIEFLLGILL